MVSQYHSCTAVGCTTHRNMGSSIVQVLSLGEYELEKPTTQSSQPQRARAYALTSSD